MLVRDNARTLFSHEPKLKITKLSEVDMHIHSGNKNASGLDQEMPETESGITNEDGEPYQQEIAAMQDDENIDLDDDSMTTMTIR